jgi:inorganic pyrophosphatase
MAQSLDKISAGVEVPDRIHAVVETPRGSKVRYAFSTEMTAFHIVTRVRDGDSYPADYGFVPSTMAQDGHLLDIFVLTEDPTFPGCVIEVRPVAVLHLSDGRIDDSKILAVPLVDDRYDDVRDLDDLSQELRDRISSFFEHNTGLSGREQEVVGWGDVKDAKDVVFKAWEGFLL